GKLGLWHAAEKEGKPGYAFEKGCDPVDAGFHEPFFAFGDAAAPYFLTRSGKLFQLGLPAKGEPKVTKVWDDAKRPLREALVDADAGRTFLAGPDLADGRQGRCFYFEPAEKPKPLPFDRTALDPVKAEEPLKSSLEFARFLLKQGKLKAPDK